MRREDRGIRMPRLLLALAAALALICSSGHARATDVPMQGGGGGGPFRSECKGQHLAGINARVGAWIDAIASKCATFVQNLGEFGPRTGLNEHGGDGGSSKAIECDRDRYISGIKIGFTRDGNRPKYLDYIEITCKVISGYGDDIKVCLDSGNGCWDRHPNPGPYNGFGLSFPLLCNANEAAVGIHGRSGSFVDAVGLICGPKPAVVASNGTSYRELMVRCRAKGGTWNPVTRRCLGGAGGGEAVPPDWADMLAAHNAKRDAHCVPRLTWDVGLASAAQSWADKCTNTHAQNTGHGENLAMFTKTDSNGKPIYPAATNAEAYQNSWYCEIKWYDFNNPKWAGGFKNGCDPPVNGHFTQVVWKGTTKVGCGIKDCGGKTYWVCRYSPAGNINVDESQVAHDVAVKSLKDNVKPLCK